MMELNFPNPVATRTDLFNREDEQAQIEQTLRSPVQRSVVILGERVIGKTSLLNVVAEWAEQELGMVALKLPTVSSRAGLAREILEAIAVEGGSSLYRAGLVDEQGRFRLLTTGEFVQAAHRLITRQAGLRSLVCLEELDSILLKSGGDSGADEILDFLLYLIERTDLPLRFLFTTSQMSPGLLRTYASPFMNAARLIRLEPWPSDVGRAFAEWLMRGRFTFDAAAHEALFAAGGGHPYLTKAVLHALLQQHRDAPPGFAIDAGLVRRGVEAAAESPEVGFTLRNIVDVHFSQAERQLLVAMAGQAGGAYGDVIGALGDRALQAAHTLERRGYVRSDGRDSYALRFGLLGDWLLSAYSLRPDRHARTAG